MSATLVERNIYVLSTRIISIIVEMSLFPFLGPLNENHNDKLKVFFKLNFPQENK